MIYYVRHGQTDENLKSIFPNRKKDCPLNENGGLQAKQTADELKNLKFDICFCSPLLRAKQTMEEILKFHNDLDVVFDKRIVERDYGDLATKSESLFPSEIRWNMNCNIGNNAETIEQMIERVNEFLKNLESYKGKNILIVAHSGVGRVFRAICEGFPKDNNLKNLGLPNAGYYSVEF